MALHGHVLLNVLYKIDGGGELIDCVFQSGKWPKKVKVSFLYLTNFIYLLLLNNTKFQVMIIDHYPTSENFSNKFLFIHFLAKYGIIAFSIIFRHRKTFRSNSDLIFDQNQATRFTHPDLFIAEINIGCHLVKYPTCFYLQKNVSDIILMTIVY